MEIIIIDIINVTKYFIEKYQIIHGEVEFEGFSLFFSGKYNVF